MKTAEEGVSLASCSLVPEFLHFLALQHRLRSARAGVLLTIIQLPRSSSVSPTSPRRNIFWTNLIIRLVSAENAVSIVIRPRHSSGRLLLLVLRSRGLRYLNVANTDRVEQAGLHNGKQF